MILRHLEIISNITNLSTQIKEKLPQIQKIYSSVRYISLQIRLPGRTSYLYFGRGHGYEGIWEGEAAIPAQLRSSDKFLGYLRKFLKSSRLIEVEADPEDRIFYLHYGRWGRGNVMGFFYCGRELFFFNYFWNQKNGEFNLFKSWENSTEKVNEDLNIFDVFIPVGKKPLQKNVTSKRELPTIATLIEEEGGGERRAKSSRRLKSLLRKADKILADQSSVNRGIELKNEMDLEELLVELKPLLKYKVGKIKVNFDSGMNPYQKRDKLLEKLKRLNSASDILQQRLLDTQKEIAQTREGLTGQSTSKETPIPIVWKTKKNIKKEVKKEGGYIIETLPSGISVGFGLNAQGNDKLRIEWGKKEDLWFHVEGEKSSHAVVKVRTIGELQQEDLKYLGIKIKELSKLDQTEVDLIYTQLKNIRGSTGKAGSVRYKNIKYITVDISDFSTI